MRGDYRQRCQTYGRSQGWQEDGEEANQFGHDWDLHPDVSAGVITEGRLGVSVGTKVRKLKTI